MKKCKIFACIFAAILLVVLITLAGCTRIRVVPPAPLLFAPAPLAVTSGQMYADFLNDATAAAAKYEGQQLWFSQVIVGAYSESTDNNLTIFMAQTPGQLIGTFHNVLGDIIIDYLLVTARTAQKFQEGDIVEVVGRFECFQDQTVTIDIDYINTLGAGGAVLPGQGSSY